MPFSIPLLLPAPPPVPLLAPVTPALALPDPAPRRLKERLVRFVAEHITPYATVIVERRHSGPVVTIGQGRFHSVSRVSLHWNRTAIAIQNGGSLSHVKIQVSPQEFLALVRRGERLRRATEWQRCLDDLADHLDALDGPLAVTHGPTGFGASTIHADGAPVLDVNPHGLHTIISAHVDKQAQLSGAGPSWAEHYAVTFGTTDEKAVFCVALDDAVLAALKRRRARARFLADLDELLDGFPGKLLVTGNYGEYSVVNAGQGGAFCARQSEGGVSLSAFVRPSERPHVEPTWKKSYIFRPGDRKWLLRTLEHAVEKHNAALTAEPVAV